MAERHDYYGPMLLFRGLFIMLVLIGLGAFVSSVVYTVSNPTMPMNYFFSFSWIGQIVGAIVSILIIVFILRFLFGMGSYPLWDEKAVARRRYARGRISRREYQEIVKELDRTR